MALGLKEKTKFSIMNILLIFFALLQALLQFLELIFAKKATNGFLALVLSIGQIISENWLAVSITLIFTVLGCLFYNSLLKKPLNSLKSVGIMFINLALCLRVYSVGSLSEKITYLRSHIPAIAIISAAILLFVTLIIVIQKARKNNKEFNIIASRTPNTDPQHLTEDSEDSDEYPYFNTQDIHDAFRLNHPFLYAYYSFTKNINENREIKREHKRKTLEIKRKEKEQKLAAKTDGTQKSPDGNARNDLYDNILGYIAVGLSVAICVVFVVFLKDQSNVPKFFERITAFILNLTKGANNMSEFVKEFLLSSGSLFLLCVTFSTLFLLLYSTIRVLLFILTRSKEDAQRIEKISKAIKSFVFGVLEGALRPLLFLPDFLECLEDVLLDVDMEESINKGNSNDQRTNSQNSSKESTE